MAEERGLGNQVGRVTCSVVALVKKTQGSIGCCYPTVMRFPFPDPKHGTVGAKTPKLFHEEYSVYIIFLFGPPYFHQPSSSEMFVCPRPFVFGFNSFSLLNHHLVRQRKLFPSISKTNPRNPPPHCHMVYYLRDIKKHSHIKMIYKHILFKMNCASSIDFINNKLLHIDAQIWFEIVQDVGDEITLDERKLSKKRVKHVFWNDRFYKDIYELASKFYINLQKHDNLVPKLPKNKFDSVKRISELTLQNQTKFSFADAHNHPEGSLFLELCASSKMSSKIDSMYNVSQQDVLSHFYQFGFQMRVKS